MDTDSIIRTQVSVLSDGSVWTLKPLGTQWCVLSSVATDALVLKHQTISNHSAEWIFIELDWFHVDVLHLLWTVLKNRTHNLKKKTEPIVWGPNYLFYIELFWWSWHRSITWTHRPHYNPFVSGIYRLSVVSTKKWPVIWNFIFSLLLARKSCWTFKLMEMMFMWHHPNGTEWQV